MAVKGTEGHCYLCGEEYGRTGMRTHLIKKHFAIPDPDNKETQDCLLIRIEGKYDNRYWLYIDIPKTSTLNTLDGFLRDIWLECCGHLSAFSAGTRCDFVEIGMSRKIKTLSPGDVLTHEYDFGSTTECKITVIAEVTRPKQRKAVRVLGRNNPIKYICCKCGKPADYIDQMALYECDEDLFYCEKCMEETNEDCEFALPVTNSPRMGVCGYCGEYDIYEYDEHACLQEV